MNKKTISLSVIVTGISFVLFFSACVKKVGMNPDLTPPVQSECDTITYAKHIKPIFDANCLSCHGNTSPSAGLSLTDYTQTKSAADLGKIKARVVDGNPSFMPQGGQLPPDQLKLVKCWLDNGKKP